MSNPESRHGSAAGWRMVALAVSLVAVAGCAGVPSGLGSESPDETVTPVSVSGEGYDTAPTPGAEASRPPGVFANGSVDLTALLSAHERHLSDRSYRLRVWMKGGEVPSLRTAESRRDWNGSFTVAVENGSEYVIAPGSDGESATPRAYRDRTGLYSVEGDGNIQREAEQSDTADGPFELEPSALRLGGANPFLPPTAVEVTRLSRDGNSLYRIHVPSDPGADTRADYDQYTAVLYVTPEGVVRSIQVQFRTAVGRIGVDHRIRYTYFDIGATTVTEPEWMGGTARANRSPNRTTTEG